MVQRLQLANWDTLEANYLETALIDELFKSSNRDLVQAAGNFVETFGSVVLKIAPPANQRLL